MTAHNSIPYTSECTRPGELSRILTAAVINKEFCELLLNNPRRALSNGYQGKAFQLDIEDRDFILSIDAKSLDDFAKHLSQRNMNGHKFKF